MRKRTFVAGMAFLKNPYKIPKGAGVFRRPGQNVEDLCKIGTSRTSNELKIGP